MALDRDAPSELAVAPTAEQLRAEIAHTRRQLAASATAARERLRRAADWRGLVSRHPYTLMAGALALGLWLGSRRR